MNITISGLNVLMPFNRNVIFHPKIGCVSSVQASLVPLTLTTRHNLTSNISQPQKPLSAVSANLASAATSLLSIDKATLGSHLAQRLVQIGVSDVFSVPGDFNLSLLDHLIAEPGLNLIGCCNELNAGYAADGYARSRGVGACVVTFTVGGLSVLNAIAGAYSENLPIICIVGAPNSNDYGANRILHHTIGLPDFSQELHCFKTVTCYQAVVNNLEDAHGLIDTAIATALIESKPVYISIACNLPATLHPAFNRAPIPFFLSPKLSNRMSLEAAVEAAAKFLNKAVKPVIVGGPKLRTAHACQAFLEFADASGYALAVTPTAKGLVPECHPHFMGTYWGVVSTTFCAEIVESADAYVLAGPMFDDGSSVGYSLLLKKDKTITVQPGRVMIGNGPTFGCILMTDFFQALAKRLDKNTTAYENYHRIYVPEGRPLKCAPNEPLRVNVLFEHIQKLLSSDTAVIAETGDSWFNCQKLKLPQGCGYEVQMQYASIGWSVGATLGYSLAATDKRVIACIGDGSFQAVVNNLEDAPQLIDKAIATALKESKPVYISICGNLPSIPHPTFYRDPIPFFISPKLSNKMALEAAVDAAAEFLNKAVNPVMVGGPQLRTAHACQEFVELADASGYALAVMPSGKGLVPEHHPHFTGTYWGVASTSFCAEIVESADACLFVGSIFDDISTVGYSLLLKKENTLIVQPERVTIGNGPTFGCILMKDFLQALTKRLKKNNTAYENYHRMYVPEGNPFKYGPNEPLRVNVLFEHIQKMLSSETTVISESGDMWFNCQKLKLPQGCGHEVQMLYCSIGWSVGATLGYAQAATNKRVIACIGDGSFQVTAQDVSTMLRCGQNPIIFLINNGGYTIEVKIHDGPYNVIKNWNYAGLVDAVHNGKGKCWTTKVFCEKDLIKAIEVATEAKKDCLCFIEVMTHKDDSSKELLEFGSRFSAANGRPPNLE